MTPFPGTWEEIQRRNLVNEILDECWKNPNAGYDIQPTDEWIVNNQQHRQLDRNAFDILEQEKFDDDDVDKIITTLEKPSTYGEITPLGARQLFGAMELLDDGPRKPKHQVSHGHFFDLGSGTGKLVGQAVLELPNKRVEKATGIELSPSRHEYAIRAKEALLRWPGSNINRTNFTVATRMIVTTSCRKITLSVRPTNSNSFRVICSMLTCRPLLIFTLRRFAFPPILCFD